MSRFGFFILAFVLSGRAFAADPRPKDEFAGKTVMHGYTLKDFAGFEKTWKFVTVRYRQDTSEMRLTYANPLAWKFLTQKSKDYPDGAVFAKIGTITQPDPAFASSAVPSGARRYQFMIRDKKKFASTDGWGYVLFDADGKTFPGAPVTNSEACAACHRIVKDRGYVFSEKMELSPHAKFTRAPWIAAGLKFETVSADSLPAALRALLPADEKKVRRLRGELATYLFAGTLDEIRPSLAQEVRREKMPAVLVGDGDKLFSAVFAVARSGLCREGEVDMKSVLRTQENETPKELSFCHQ